MAESASTSVEELSTSEETEVELAVSDEDEGTEFECWCPVDTIFADSKETSADSSIEGVGNPQNRSGSVELQPGIYRFTTEVINESAADESSIGHSMGIATGSSRASMTKMICSEWRFLRDIC